MPATIEQVEIALGNAGGIVAHAAQQLGIGRSALCQRIQKDKYLQAKVEECRDTNLDLSESKLMSLIGKENLGAIIFHLKCLGKKRGYVEQSPEKPVQLNLQVNVDRLGEALRSELEHKSRAAIDIDSDPLD